MPGVVAVNFSFILRVGLILIGFLILAKHPKSMSKTEQLSFPETFV